jgi:hypothetical protein
MQLWLSWNVLLTILEATHGIMQSRDRLDIDVCVYSNTLFEHYLAKYICKLGAT